MSSAKHTSWTYDIAQTIVVRVRLPIVKHQQFSCTVYEERVSNPFGFTSPSLITGIPIFQCAAKRGQMSLSATETHLIGQSSRKTKQFWLKKKERRGFISFFGICSGDFFFHSYVCCSYNGLVFIQHSIFSLQKLLAWFFCLVFQYKYANILK